MRFAIALKYKIYFLAFAAVLGTAALYRNIAWKTLEKDRKETAWSSAQSALDASRRMVRAYAHSRVSELKALTFSTASRSSQSRFFEAASEELREELLSVTYYRPAKTQASIQSLTNTALLRHLGLPRNTPLLVEEAIPLDLEALPEAQSVTWLNRSFTHGGKAVGIQTAVFYQPGNQPMLVVANLISEPLQALLQNESGARTYLVDLEGQLVAHADTDMQALFVRTPFPAFAKAELPETWVEGSRIENGDTFQFTAPTAFHNVFLVSTAQTREYASLLSDIDDKFMFGGWSILGLALAYATWLSWRLRRNTLNTAAALNQLASGEMESIPKIRGRDEFLAIKTAFERLLPEFQKKLFDEFSKGQRDALYAATQSLRATLQVPTVTDFTGWNSDILRPTAPSSLQDFWDCRTYGNRRQFLIGRSSTDGVSGVLLGLFARATLDNIRRLAQQINGGRELSMLETLEILNGTLYSAFQGRTTLLANVCDLNLDTGELTWINAGGPPAVRWTPKHGEPVSIDIKSLETLGTALGTDPAFNPHPVSTVLAPGERIFIHTQTLTLKTTVQDEARLRLLHAIATHGEKPLEDVRAAVLGSGMDADNLLNLSALALQRPAQVEEFLRAA
ncbi:serine/threonine-protein phosphatase [bacterium]|nr:serine/threonine-protein phosphatase [bacterium]